MSRRDRQCWGRHALGDDKVLEVDFLYDGQDVGEYHFSMALDDKVITEQDLIALIGPEAARSAVEEAIANGIDRPY